jgi:PncC family amidohydrolase
MKTFKRIIKKLTDEHLTISTMESCTGGAVANAITSIEGASLVFKFAAVTYSNEYKIKMGVSKDVIDKYSVYSMETAKEMARAISVFDEADIGIGITGKLNRADSSNNFGKDNEVFISIFYDNMYYDKSIIVDKKTRKQNKELVIKTIIEGLGEILWKER